VRALRVLYKRGHHYTSFDASLEISLGIERTVPYPRLQARHTDHTDHTRVGGGGTGYRWTHRDEMGTQHGRRIVGAQAARQGAVETSSHSLNLYCLTWSRRGALGAGGGGDEITGGRRDAAARDSCSSNRCSRLHHL